MESKEMIAAALLKIGAVGFIHGEPITFKSGMRSPVYVDNRIFPFHPEEWQTVIEGFAAVIEEKHLAFDIIAGIETAGIPHSAALSFLLKKPTVFVRKKVKDHGTKSKIEGGSVKDQRVLLIEDHVTTGSSSLAGVEALREAGAVVTDCLSITSYEFEDSTKAFNTAKVKLHTLTSFAEILKAAQEKKIITNQLKVSVQEWLADPWQWGKEHE